VPPAEAPPERLTPPKLLEGQEVASGDEPGNVLEELPDYLTLVAEESTTAEAESDPDWWMPPWEAEQAGTPEAKPPVHRERRVEARLPSQFGIGVVLDREGTTLNLSATGLAMAVPIPADPGELVVFAIHAPAGLSRGAARIVWVREVATEPPSICLGLQLINVDGRYRELIQALSPANSAAVE
jgi:hypothetical protein